MLKNDFIRAVVTNAGETETVDIETETENLETETENLETKTIDISIF